MKAIATALILIAIAAPVSANVVIGLFEDISPQNADCWATTQTYTTTSVYVCAQKFLAGDIDPVITAAEFRIDGLPDTSEALVTPFWNTDLTIGLMDHGIALAFQDPLPGLFAVFGELQIFTISDLWPGDDHYLSVANSNTSGLLSIVDGDYVTWSALGGQFVLNPWSEDWDYCPYIYIPSTATEESSWGRVKSLY